MRIEDMAEITFPKESWQTTHPGAVEMDAGKVEKAQRWFAEMMGEGKGRLVIVRSGRVVLEYYHQIEAAAKPGIASAAKSIYSNVLGILISEGRLKSADERVVDYYPEMMDVKEGEGNKPGRHAFEANREITFRHLICNVSGYMKPGEEPGKLFNYQSWGMNILTHALAKIYGLYDVRDPEGSRGFQVLIKEKLADPIGADWEYSCKSPAVGDRLSERARLDIFGGYTGVHSTALDLARVGWLWCNGGKWDGKQVVPEKWLKETMAVARDILANCPEEEWMYGHGIWTNAEGQIWPHLPKETVTSSGAGGHFWTVFPSQELVIVQNPGRAHSGDRGVMANPELLEMVLDTCG
jgi:CubicO group peptidase (beta-lactamase class C family)